MWVLLFLIISIFCDECGKYDSAEGLIDFTKLLDNEFTVNIDHIETGHTTKFKLCNELAPSECINAQTYGPTNFVDDYDSHSACWWGGGMFNLGYSYDPTGKILTITYPGQASLETPPTTRSLQVNGICTDKKDPVATCTEEIRHSASEVELVCQVESKRFCVGGGSDMTFGKVVGYFFLTIFIIIASCCCLVICALIVLAFFVLTFSIMFGGAFAGFRMGVYQKLDDKDTEI